MTKLVLLLAVALLGSGCSSDSGTGGTGGSGTGGSGTGGSGTGGSGTGGSGGSSSNVSCADWCAHFYTDLQCDPAGEAECVGDCEGAKQSGDFSLPEAQCQVSAATCAAWDDCATQF